MVKGRTSGAMDESIQGSGNGTRWVQEDTCSGLMVASMRESSRMARSMVMGLCRGPMADLMLDNGKVADSMVLELLLQRKVSPDGANGILATFSSGSRRLLPRKKHE